MILTTQISWGKYNGFAGPYFRGSIPYTLPENHNEDDRRLRVVTATEGGCYDAGNFYDSCIASLGLIQWCEAAGFLTSKLLHGVCEAGYSENLLKALQPALDLCSAEFKKNSSGQWRFFMKGIEVTTRAQQQALFLGCDGTVGSWTDEAKVRAKLWAACLANVWSDPKAREVQADFTKKRLMGFIIKDARQLLWDSTPDTGWNGMLRAAFLSFAANNSQKANDNVIKAASSTMTKKWSPEWCIHALQVMTFGTTDKPTPAIYGSRYDKIRPWLELLWSGVVLPKSNADLKAWIQPKIGDVITPIAPVPDVVIPPLPPLPVIKQPSIDQVGSDSHAPIQTLPEVAITASPVPDFAPNGVLGFILRLLMKLFGR